MGEVFTGDPEDERLDLLWLGLGGGLVSGLVFSKTSQF